MVPRHTSILGRLLSPKRCSSLLSLFPRRVASVPLRLLFCSVKLAFSSILLFLSNPLLLFGRFTSGALGFFACVLSGARGVPCRCSDVSCLGSLPARCPSLDLTWVICGGLCTKLLQN